MGGGKKRAEGNRKGLRGTIGGYKDRLERKKHILIPLPPYNIEHIF